MHLAPLIRDLALILGVAAAVTFVFHRIRQPVVLGYIVAGFLVVRVPGMPGISDLPNVRTWAELGVIFLMFTLGLDFSFRKLARVGISASITAVWEVGWMFLVGTGLGYALGWSRWDTLFFGGMLAISSTTIIIKALDGLNLRSRRFAQMIFGVLIVEDLLAILLLVILTMIGVKGSVSGLAVLTATGKLVLVIGSWFLVGYFVVPRFVRHVGLTGSAEMLTILSLGLCLMLAVFAAQMHYSTALGAFVMGSILSESTESHRIEEIMAPLKDLFSAVFFVSVGMLIDLAALRGHGGQIAIIVGVFLVAKITAVTIGALITGQTVRQAVQVAFGLAQIGEFSFIIATLGQGLGLTSEFLFPVAVAVSVVTTFFTPYLVRVSHDCAVWLEGRLPWGLRHALVQYAAWSQERRASAAKREDFYRRFLRWGLNGILVSVIFIVIAELGLPQLLPTPEVQGEFPWIRLAAWLGAVLLSAPFLWAMLATFRSFRLGPGAQEGGTTLVMRGFTALWLVGLSLDYFPVRYTLGVAAAAALVLFAIFYRRLERSYSWFEKQFLSGIQGDLRKSGPRPGDELKHLAPWDAHLVRIKVHPNAEIAGQTLAQAELRSRHGINVVAIRRGLKTIVAPKPGAVIFPKDELLALGTDEQIEAIRFSIEKPPGLQERFQGLQGYDMRPLLVEEGMSLCGQTLRQANLAERAGATVVGLERGEKRILNPDSTVTLKAGDRLWLVGETEALSRLRAELDA